MCAGKSRRRSTPSIPLRRITTPSPRYAKTLRRDGKYLGRRAAVAGRVRTQARPRQLDRSPARSATPRGPPVCFGCHLPMSANETRAHEQIRGHTTRNYTTYNPQVVRDDVFMLGPGRHGEGQPARGDPLLERGRGRFAERQPRMGLFAAADGLRRGLQRAGVQPAFPAHDQRRRHDQELHRLPSLRGKRQQRDHDAVARLRHRHRQFLRPLRLCRRREGRLRRRGLDGAGGTAGGHRQPSAADWRIRTIIRQHVAQPPGVEGGASP